jgi:hypothetical protein
VSDPRRLIVAPNAEIVGRWVRRILDDRILDDDVRVAGFVGDLDADREVLDEFVGDAVREATSPSSSLSSSLSSW